MDPHASLNRGHVYRDRVAATDAGRSVLDYHARHFAHSDETVWRRAIESGLVRVNGRVAAATTALAQGDELEFHRPPWEEPDAPLEFVVVHEDEHVLAVAKPSGLQVLPAGPFLEKTLWNIVRASDPSRADSAPVHRLGRGTSGIVLFGKTNFARARLSEQFRACTPRKTYFAIVKGCALPDSFVARQPIGRIAHGPMHIWIASESGKPSATRDEGVGQRATLHDREVRLARRARAKLLRQASAREVRLRRHDARRARTGQRRAVGARRIARTHTSASVFSGTAPPAIPADPTVSPPPRRTASSCTTMRRAHGDSPTAADETPARRPERAPCVAAATRPLTRTRPLSIARRHTVSSECAKCRAW